MPAPPQSAREIVLSAFEAAGAHSSLTPADVEAWYNSVHGDLPVTSATLRGFMSREASKREGALAKDEYGSYSRRGKPVVLPERTGSADPLRHGYTRAEDRVAEADARDAARDDGQTLVISVNGQAVWSLTLERVGPPVEIAVGAGALSSETS